MGCAMSRQSNGRLYRSMKITLSAGLVMAALAGCTANDESALTSAGVPASTSTKLSPLSEQDISAHPLKGELICAFAVGRKTLLYAAGNVATLDDSDGIVKFGEEVMRIRSPGGFDTMLRGTSFKGDKLVLQVKLAEHVDQPEKAGSNGATSYPPSNLTYIRGSGPSRSLEGRWECGP